MTDTPPPLPKTKEQRQAESRAAELARPYREAEKARQRLTDHDSAYEDVIVALASVGVHPERLREWLAGPPKWP